MKVLFEISFPIMRDNYHNDFLICKFNKKLIDIYNKKYKKISFCLE